ncbi:MAG: hypothetical protein ACFFG0_15395 [Candidatus Thorarchaeota archaeon]
MSEEKRAKFEINYWKCLECKSVWSTERIESLGKCPKCGCTDFNVNFSEWIEK